MTVMAAAAAAGPVFAQIQVSPTAVSLDSPESTQQLLVSGAVEGQLADLTRQASYEVIPANLATIDAAGLVRPSAEGRGEIVVRQGAAEQRLPLEVTGMLHPAPVSFQHEVIPIITKATCNAGGCHGKAEGQNGFKLSVFGYDPALDHAALVKEGRGRRLNVAAPDTSLLLLKATATVPHGGGYKIEPGGYRYRRLRRWIAEGANFSVAGESPSMSIEVEPREQVLTFQGSQQVRVTSIDAAGHRRCVTTEAAYSSNAPTIADVDARGLIQASDVPGEAAILVRYMGHVAVCRIALPRPGVRFARPAENNFIDGPVWDKLQRLGIEPSGLADDATFLRRAFLDTIGRLPTSQEAREFLADAAADKRAKLIDRLLEREEYVDYCTMRWSDILRIDQQTITPEGAVAATRWLRRQIAENRPYDQLVREILTVQGSTLAEGPAAIYKALVEPDVMSRSISQVFLGVRIECAHCHHHPFERWGQDDYFGLAGFFTGVTRKTPAGQAEAIVARGGADLKHPRTGEVIPARALGAAPADFSAVSDRRVVLADWMTAPGNPFFAKTVVNRIWSHYFGRGLVEPLDDLRETNPATNGPLFEALAKHLQEQHYDLKAFTRTLLNSRVYQLSSESNESNAGDRQNFSHALDKALPAEVLLDAVCQVTGVPEKFNGWPFGYRAVQIWDSRMPSYFLRVFGRPVRASVCECERSNEPSIAQALHLMNSPEVAAKIHSHEGAVRTLSEASADNAALVDELYLSTLSRFPTADEREIMLSHVSASGNRRAAAEDILWALVNSKEFLSIH